MAVDCCIRGLFLEHLVDPGKAGNSRGVSHLQTQALKGKVLQVVTISQTAELGMQSLG
jgi:hypothetical protein